MMGGNGGNPNERIERVELDVQKLKARARASDHADGVLASVDAGLTAQASGLLDLSKRVDKLIQLFELAAKREASQEKRINRAALVGLAPVVMLATTVVPGVPVSATLASTIAVLVLAVLAPQRLQQIREAGLLELRDEPKRRSEKESDPP